MVAKHKKPEVEVAPEPVAPVAEHPEVVVTTVAEKPPAPVGATLAATAAEQLAGQVAIASAEERRKAEIEAGARAVAAAQARARAAAAE